MDIRQLRYFIEIARQKSFTQASARLRISQPALSKTVKNIEEEIGAEVFDRKNKSIALTDCGEVLLEAARKAVLQFDAITESLNDITTLKKGKLAVGIPSVIGTTYFAPIIARFKHAYPGIDLRIVEEGARTILTQVIESQINIGIIIAPANPEEIDIVPVMKDKNVVVVNTSNPLARKRRVEFQDLAGEAFCIFNDKFMLHGQIIARCREAGFEPHISMTSSQWDLIMELVSLNQGITVLPRPIAAKGKYAHVKILPIVPAFPWEIILITRKGNRQSYAMREFIRCVRSSFGRIK